MSRIDNTGNRTRTSRVRTFGLTLALVVSCGAGNVAAQQAPFVYPAQGQSVSDQAADEGHCRSFAQQQTGFNPSQGPAYYSDTTGGEAVGGAARGAMLGAIGGAIAGNAGKGAAIGAGVGGAGGFLRKSQKRQSTNRANEQSQQQYSQNLNNYHRAFGACMQGRGYTVN